MSLQPPMPPQPSKTVTTFYICRVSIININNRGDPVWASNMVVVISILHNPCFISVSWTVTTYSKPPATSIPISGRRRFTLEPESSTIRVEAQCKLIEDLGGCLAF
ncbi:unnamed protein product [Linum trigynum]|uniref:Uncharacterized protein n=1 Tax=Linum trigynum TaxID=586398 RepID=A0AAV2CDZ5_9ROSI